MFEDQNLLDIAARNPREYSRILLRTLFKSHELQTCLLPSSYSKRFLKPELDSDRFDLLNGNNVSIHSFFFRHESFLSI